MTIMEKNKELRSEVNEEGGYDLVVQLGEKSVRFKGGDISQSKQFWAHMEALSARTLAFLETEEVEPGVIAKLKTK